MKRIYTFLVPMAIGILLTASVFAQAPEKMSYQAVIRNASNQLVSSKTVGMRISILQGLATGTVVYSERQTPTTNANGLVSIEIGGGAAVTGTFASIDWANGPYFIKTETDPTGGTSYTITGTSQLLSVPYALYAKTTGGLTSIISAFQPVGCRHLPTVTQTWQKIADMGSATKISADTWFELTLQTTLYVDELLTGCTGVEYELRVDDVATTIGNATALVKNEKTFYPVSINGVFKNISSGVHTISLWARSSNANATDAYYDPGCYNVAGINNVLIKEYK